MSDPREAFVEAVAHAARAFVALLDAAPGRADELVDVAKCGLELAAVRRLVREGRLHPVTIGRRRYVRRSALLALLDELEAAPGPTKKTESQRSRGRLLEARRPLEPPVLAMSEGDLIARGEEIGRRWGNAEADFWLARGEIEKIAAEASALRERLERAIAAEDKALERVERCARAFAELVSERDEHARVEELAEELAEREARAVDLEERAALEEARS